MVEHIADVLENTGAALDSISHDIFRKRGASKNAVRESAKPAGDEEKPRDLEEALLRLGRCSDLVSRLRESLAGLRRMLSFLPRPRSTCLPTSPSICGRSVRIFNRWAITLRFFPGK